MATEHYDIVIIGSGAGGGTLAWKLAPMGKRILLLERGGYLPRERDNWDTEAVFLHAKYTTDEVWEDADGAEFTPEQNYYVGGNTKFYGAALFRLRPEDFGVIKHHSGLSPAWPIGYDDLEAFYTDAERLYCVHGSAGEDPTDGPRSGPYPYPAVQHEPRIQTLSDDLEKLGLHPSHLPIGVMLEQDEHGEPLHSSRCVRCDRVDGFPCLVDGKADAQVVCVDPTLAHPNLELVTGTKVERLETDTNGRTVTEVVATQPDGSEVRYSADVVVVSCGALNSALLLLRSANEAHPNGLANGSDQVGRNYMRHNNLAMMALSIEPNPTRFQKTLALNDWYLKGEDTDYPWGGIQMLGKSDGEQLKGKAPHFLAWGAKMMPDRPLETVARHGVDFWLSSEDLPHPDNRLTVDKDGTVRLGLVETNPEGLKRLRKKFASMLTDLGMHHGLYERKLYLHEAMDISATAHQAGTARFGADPSSSALDVNCKAHELDNLYVVDSSFFPSIGAVNPTLTIIANALRVGDHLAERVAQMLTNSAALLAVNPVPWARSQMAFTLGFHIILVPLGVSWAFMTLIANYKGVKHNDKHALVLAERWSKFMAVTFAVGAVTGTVLTFEFGLLWPKFMGRWGPAFGIPFAIEGLFFFTEAIFVAVYIYGWRRLRPWQHFWTGVPIVIAGIGGAVSVVAANSWMNQPQGFTLNSAGKVVDVDAVSVIFNKAMPYESAHMLVAAYLVGGFLIASVYAMGLLRGRRDRYHRLGFLIPFTVAAIVTPIQLLVGDTLARWVYNNEPTKFAAIELVPKTKSDVPETLFGHLSSNGTVSGGIKIPGLASVLSDPSTGKGTVVKGLNAFPKGSEPTTAQVNVVHLGWDVMVGLGTFLFLLSLWFGITWLFRRRIPKQRLFLWIASASGVLAVITMEAGWVVTEVGRQPWIVFGQMKVSQAATTNQGVWVTFLVITAIYAVVGATTILVLRRMSRRWREAGGLDESDVPYGPSPTPEHAEREVPVG